jgi:hypothetical protein
VTETKPTDRERVLTNIAAHLASALYSLQLNPAVRAVMDRPGSYHDVRTEGCAFSLPPLTKGDLVLCLTSSGIKQNPFLVSYVEEVGLPHDPRGLVLRAIGTEQTCNYSNESFVKITGIPDKFLWEGEKQSFVTKLHKALRKCNSYANCDSYGHRYRTVKFPEDGIAEVIIGECFGGLARPSKPYTIRIPYTKRTTIKFICQQLTEQGYGSRKFELEEVKEPELSGIYEG